MIVPALTDGMTRRQHAAWNDLVRRCRLLDDRGSGAGWVFHGTDHLSSTHILKGGFTVGHSGPREQPWTHWGSAEMAAGWAEARSSPDSPPTLLAARTRDVLASGLPMADAFAMEEGCNYRGAPFPDWEAIRPEYGAVPEGWRGSYLAVGAFVVQGGVHVDGLMRLGIQGLPLHPLAEGMRRNRTMAEDRRWMLQPHPDDAGIEIDRDGPLFPNRFREHAAYMLEFPEGRRDGIRFPEAPIVADAFTPTR